MALLSGPVLTAVQQSPSVIRSQAGSPTARSAGGSFDERRTSWSLGEGAGARRLAEVKVRAAVQLLVVQVRTDNLQRLAAAGPCCFVSASASILQMYDCPRRCSQSRIHAVLAMGTQSLCRSCPSVMLAALMGPMSSCAAARSLQACGEVYGKNARHMPPAAAVMLLDVLKSISTHSGSIDADIGLRHSLLLAQAADKVGLAVLSGLPLAGSG